LLDTSSKIFTMLPENPNFTISWPLNGSPLLHCTDAVKLFTMKMGWWNFSSHNLQKETPATEC
jgi:hypothetical protein